GPRQYGTVFSSLLFSSLDSSSKRKPSRVSDLLFLLYHLFLSPSSSPALENGRVKVKSQEYRPMY
ncbi:MAG: hypothetical protein ACREBU_06625, partial [Nitrososphaera sp.]